MWKIDEGVDVIMRSKAMMREICEQRKQHWRDLSVDVNQSYSEYCFDKSFDGQILDLTNLLRVLTRLYHRLSTDNIEENKFHIANIINRVAIASHENFIVDDNLVKVKTDEKPLTELIDIFQQKRRQSQSGKRNRISHSTEERFLVASLSKIQRDKSTSQEKIEQGTLNYTLAIFDSKLNSFSTNFFSYENMTDPKKNMKKRFAFDKSFKTTPNSYLVAMVVLTDNSGANKCKGVGVVKLDNPDIDQDKAVDIEIRSTRNLSVPVPDIIKRFIKEESQMKEDTLLVLPFKFKVLDQLSLDANDVILEKVSELGLRDVGVNRLVLTIDTGK